MLGTPKLSENTMLGDTAIRSDTTMTTKGCVSQGIPRTGSALTSER